MPRRYKVFDVFAETPLAGNPLAVVLDAEGLETATMQAVAREFNLSETVFVLPPRDPAAAAALRIFTPARELPFAGHPTVGAAVCIAGERSGTDAVGSRGIVLEEAVGAIPCRMTLSAGGGFAEFDCPRLPQPAAIEVPAAERIALALGLPTSEIGFDSHAASAWSAGVPYHCIPVRNRAALAKAAPNGALWPDTFGSEAAFLYTRDAEGEGHAFRARMFAPELGIAEDPATGSAVAAFAGPVHAFDALPDGSHALVVEQGFEMGRPSLICLGIGVVDRRIVDVRIGGAVVAVMSGTLAF